MHSKRAAIDTLSFITPDEMLEGWTDLSFGGMLQVHCLVDLGCCNDTLQKCCIHCRATLIIA